VTHWRLGNSFESLLHHSNNRHLGKPLFTVSKISSSWSDCKKETLALLQKSQQWRALKAHHCAGISFIQDKRENYAGTQFKIITGSTSVFFLNSPKITCSHYLWGVLEKSLVCNFQPNFFRKKSSSCPLKTFCDVT